MLKVVLLDERGAALLGALMAGLLLGAIGSALVLIAASETAISSSFQ